MQGYDASKTGREKHVTASGRVIERKYFYYSSAEWDLLYSLSKDSGVSLGRMLMGLAYAERVKRSADYQRRLDNISH